ncbi:hypothetical protein IQ227_05090 [Anabaena aphanizomenioides LEGE 00250]|uniref:Uncharacterized protein n=1 Tax=Sphaerospermopsis aphanizomenoides LEGE 00250 TaxID=2777972 RepID=A0ABR9VA92_9CYAN|nr:hypothetical protein [Sphaerospermopsis aphanizomenoides]MBE9235428.1 hypothetical protein [Sphaerospermopsis aphanizomenoides LEGE 00250]
MALPRFAIRSSGGRGKINISCFPNHQSPITNHQSPVPNHQSPTYLKR